MVAGRGEGGFKFEWPVHQAPQTPLSVPRMAVIQEELPLTLQTRSSLGFTGQ